MWLGVEYQPPHNSRGQVQVLLLDRGLSERGRQPCRVIRRSCARGWNITTTEGRGSRSPINSGQPGHGQSSWELVSEVRSARVEYNPQWTARTAGSATKGQRAWS